MPQEYNPNKQIPANEQLALSWVKYCFIAWEWESSVCQKSTKWEHHEHWVQSQWLKIGNTTSAAQLKVRVHQRKQWAMANMDKCKKQGITVRKLIRSKNQVQGA